MLRRLAAVSAIALICLSAVAIAGGGDTKSMTGTISSVDTPGKSLVIKDATGQEVTIYWKDDTTVVGEIKAGQPVQIETKQLDGKIWAISIRVEPKKPY